MDRKPNDTSFPFAFAPQGALVGSAPNPFSAPEVETAHALAASDAVWSQDVWSQDTGEGEDDELPRPEAIDVRVLWGTNVLHFAQLCPPRPFTLGNVGSDFALPEGCASGAACDLVVLRDGRPCVVIPAGATARARLVNGASLSLLQCVEKGMAQRSSATTDAYEIALPQGSSVTVSLPGSEIVFEVSRVRASHKLVAGFWDGADLSGHLFTGMSALVHASLLGALAFFLPSMHGDDAETIDRNSAAAMRPYLEAMAEKEPEHTEALAALEAATPSGGGSGSQAAGSSGAMGNPVSASTAPARFAIRGDAPTPKIARERALSEAAQFGMVGLLNTDVASSESTPIASWGGETAVGHDPRSAQGTMWAQSIDDAWGPGGLGLSGSEQGGGGLAHGIGLDGIGTTIGHGGGELPGDGPGRGPGHDFGPGGHGSPRGGLRDHQPGAPILRERPLSTFSGTLPKEVVQRIVRQNFGRFRLCYEAGLRGNPGLTGRVAVAFVIGRTGDVAVAAADRSTDMADQNVVSCVVRGFQNLSFPAPKDGTVQVVYPLMLAPGE